MDHIKRLYTDSGLSTIGQAVSNDIEIKIGDIIREYKEYDLSDLENVIFRALTAQISLRRIRLYLDKC